MPLYLYEFIEEESASEPRRFERLEPMGSTPLTHHPETGEPVKRIIAAPARPGAYAGLPDSPTSATSGVKSAPRTSCGHGGNCGHHH